MNEISVRVYSSSANVGSGFDIFAVATDAFSEILKMRHSGSSGTEIVVKFNGDSVEPLKNTAGYAVYRVINDLQIKGRFEIETIKEIPPGMGLGSSAASSAASVFAINSLLDLGLKNSDLVRYSMIGDSVASGSGHADNVSASLFGGFELVVGNELMKPYKIPVNFDLYFLIVVPKIHIEQKTMKARMIIPESISREAHVANLGYFASLLYGLMNGDRASISDGINDSFAERSRIKLYPYLDELRMVSMEYSSLGAFLSGAGPSVSIVCDGKTDMSGLKSGIDNVMKKYGLDYYTKKCKIAGGVAVE
ncbi:MAG: homoserine kinase [Thermoplasmata archaeon]